ncbi:GNAT family N-acetyltransferase [Porcincola intestinalis]|uniref:GNAT family N-acetyltransferase n=1 Tax=Porcincola intestinalis TaxID=2606632 RepID=A0A6L5X6A9_9FIRM|nr:GNAT family N-acetyltransferase [Porcincola intestinalis]MCI6766777.1 GNAT family N-acetyltransferase [Lachnospiraceae bacterium]MCI7092766.1 GNAT family N-acetyltransferase [Lachnospiraceae bacterium]MDD7061037.1 GNAT family N-acetyltransferase [Porcincola intestinalis]MDY5284057.1 GNAT family N-acetyltransferase [Porcincola intestinalis]MSS15800.1 GNAT family N-acetyltransferase [Porcincola intestinalis]
MTYTYSFRPVRPEEGDQIAFIEQVCFSPATALSPETMKARAAELPDMFLAAIAHPEVPSGMSAGPGSLPAMRRDNGSVQQPDGRQNACTDGKSTSASGVKAASPDDAHDQIAGYITMMMTDEEHFRDAFFEDPSLHQPNGANVMLLGLEVLPSFRHQGLAAELLNRTIRQAEKEGRRKLVLTCRDDKIAMYEKFGFQLGGISKSTLGGVTWYEMEHRLQK